jgi:hypothetical protein
LLRSVTNNGQNTAVKASVKAVQGDLHFLEKSMLFVAKQPILIDYNQISKASFSRYVTNQMSLPNAR